MLALVRAMLLVPLLLIGCDRAPAGEVERPTEPCVADEIGELRAGWNEREGCTTESTECRDACVAGNADACFSLAISMQTEHLPDADDPQVEARYVPYFERACRLGLATGCTNWAAAQLFGETPPATRCLYRMFERACEVGEPFGCSMTARILIEWPRTPIDVWIGYQQLASACDANDGPPCRFLAYYLELGRFGTAEPARIEALLERACDGGDIEACGKQRAEDAMN